MSAKLKGVPLDDEVREIVYNVYEFMAREAEEARHGVLFENPKYFNKIMDRTTFATGYTRRSIQKQFMERKTPASTSSRGTGVPTVKTKAIKLDKFDYPFIRQTVYKMHLVEKTLPTLKNLSTVLQEATQFKGCIMTLRNLLLKLGFVFKKTSGWGHVLIETNKVRLQRLKYLRGIERFRSEGRNIVYSFKDFSQYKEDGSTRSIAIFNAAGYEGFLPQTLLVYEMRTKDENEAVDREIQDRCLKQCLMNIPANSVFIVDYDYCDHAVNTTTQDNEIPDPYANIFQMQEWLVKNNITFEPGMVKPELYEIIQQHKTTLQDSIDNIVSEYGHTILRIPEYHPELNFIECLWSKLKPQLSDQKPGIEKPIGVIVEEIFNSVTQDEYAQAWSKITNTEMEYLRQEYDIDQYLEQFKIDADDSAYHSNYW